MYKKLLIAFCLLAGLCFQSMASGPIKKPALKPVKYNLQTDTSKVDIRSFNTNALNNYRKNPGYNYHENAPANESWWTRFWRWFWRVIERFFENKTPGSPPAFLKYSLMAIAIGVLIYMITKIVGVTNIFHRKPQQVEVPYTETLEDIHKITFDEEIEKAMAVGNYRLAVRLLYLRCLKQLNDGGLIRWQIDKTNNEYLNELTNTQQRQSFSILTKQFEYTWYGDFPIDGNLFQTINASFHEFKQTMP